MILRRLTTAVMVIAALAGLGLAAPAASAATPSQLQIWANRIDPHHLAHWELGAPQPGDSADTYPDSVVVVAPNVPNRDLHDLMTHEFGHINQLHSFGGGQYAFLSAENALDQIAGRSFDNRLQGLEHSADCMAKDQGAHYLYYGCRQGDARFSYLMLAGRDFTKVLGHNDRTLVAGHEIIVQGWSMDPHAPAQSTEMRITIDGTPWGTTANGNRPDVNKAYGTIGNHGYSFGLNVSSGKHTVCESGEVANGYFHANQMANFGCKAVVVK